MPYLLCLWRTLVLTHIPRRDQAIRLLSPMELGNAPWTNHARPPLPTLNAVSAPHIRAMSCPQRKLWLPKRSRRP